jgi:sulfate transport system permease protein
MKNLSSTIAARRSVRHDPWYVRLPLIAFTVGFLGVMVLGPLVNVFVHGFELGVGVVIQALSEPAAQRALKLTLITTACAVGFNITFGLAAAWAISRFRFAGKAVLNALIDLPFSVSPVIAGLIFVLIFGAYGFVGSLSPRVVNIAVLGFAGFVGYLFLPVLLPWKKVRAYVPGLRYGVLISLPILGALLPASGPNIEIIFALPGIALATTFVTFPFIARELIPVMEALGPEEEEASRTLGASGWQMFWYVTLPNIKWGLLYGVLLCNARAIGEFGAVSVVSGRLRGQTETLPILIERLYQGFGRNEAASAFAISGLLCFLALLTLFFKTFLEWKTRQAILESTKTTEKELT